MDKVAVISVYTGLIVLLPIIPAYSLYKTLPSRTFVRGPFSGLNVHLTGAFGGYFVIVLLLVGFVAKLHHSYVAYDLWTVEGKVEFVEDGKHEPLIAIRPPDVLQHPDGSFTIQELPVVKDGVEQVPALYISEDGYETATVHLEEEPRFGGEDYGVTIEGRKIRISRPITMRRGSGYEEGEPQSSDSELGGL